jgi:hypothetical protein
VTSKRSSNRRRRWFSAALAALPAPIPEDEQPWAAPALQLLGDLLTISRIDLAAPLAARMVLAAQPEDGGAHLIDALARASWPNCADAERFVTVDVQQARDHELLSRQAAQERANAIAQEGDRRRAESDAQAEARAAAVAAERDMESARQAANRRRYPRRIAR